MDKENSLSRKYPNIAKQWHPKKNGMLTPNQVSYGTHKKVWWKCEKDHEWEASVHDRTGGYGCPYCSGRKVCADNCLSTNYPELAKQWHPTKNGNLKPTEVTCGIAKKVWWICEEGHEWQTSINSRTSNGTGCPYCSGHKVDAANTLQALYPELAKQWHPTKNEDITPDKVSCGSGYKAWWVCEEGHEWQTRISHRINGHDCPYCSGLKVTATTNLQVLYPEIASQWNPTKNGKLTPFDVKPQSGKKVWWICEKGHEYQAYLSNRIKGHGCPYCSGLYCVYEKSIEAKYPQIAKDWHLSKNGELTPDKVSYGSGLKVWWRCEKGHEWETTPSHRISGNGCPYCSGHKVNDTNSLATLYPDIANEWHPIKNGILTPSDVPVGSGIKVWWQCAYGHEWYTAIGNRVKGTKCPICRKEFHTSFPEQAILFYLSKVFAHVAHEYVVDKFTIDVVIPKLNLAIEYDGGYAHRDKQSRDEKKNHTLKQKGIYLIRIREEGLPDIDMCGFPLFKYNYTSNYSTLSLPIQSMFQYIKDNFHLSEIERQAIETLNINIEIVQQEIYQLYLTDKSNRSLAVKYPLIAAEWHPVKNGSLKPNQVFYGSSKKVWWKCPVGHEWITSVNNRTNKKNGGGCPYCSNKKVSEDNCLQTLYPQLCEEWNYLKNGILTPFDVVSGSNKKVWWTCKNGHEFQQTIIDRTGAKKAGCPYCSNKRVCRENSLATTDPQLAKQWHPTKNENLNPTDITSGSNKKVWWLCEQGHEWMATPNHRKAGRNCPYCYKVRRSKNK